MKNVFSGFILAFGLMVLASCTKSTVACFSVSGTTVPVNTVVSFDASCSRNAAYYSWEFGDNQTELNLTTTSITHTYTTTGVYTIRLNVKRKDGVSTGDDLTSITQTIHVQ